MAALGADQIASVYSNGACGHTALFAVKAVSAGDTVDLVDYFKYVKRAGIVSDTGATIGACTITTPTVLTFPSGPANDGVWLLVVGVAA